MVRCEWSLGVVIARRCRGSSPCDCSHGQHGAVPYPPGRERWEWVYDCWGSHWVFHSGWVVYERYSWEYQFSNSLWKHYENCDFLVVFGCLVECEWVRGREDSTPRPRKYSVILEKSICFCPCLYYESHRIYHEKSHLWFCPCLYYETHRIIIGKKHVWFCPCLYYEKSQFVMCF